MTPGNNNYQLPGKVDSYLAALNRLYEQSGEVILREIVVNGRLSITESWEYDNYDGGITGHAITLTVPEAVFFKVMKDKDNLQHRLAEDINNLDNSKNERVGELFIEMEPADSDNWREQSEVYQPRLATTPISDEALKRIWGQHHVRVFLSHKSKVKDKASALKDSLAQFGVAAFVAHEDIEPTEEWHREIEWALFSMNALVALLTDDFHDSDWTDQEVGVAIGRCVPFIAVRLGRDPYGLMGNRQGLGKCKWEDPLDMAVKIFQLLYKRLPDKSQLFKCALSAYAEAEDFGDSIRITCFALSVFENLSQEQVNLVLAAHRTNDQNKNSTHGTKNLLPLLNKWTGKTWSVVDKELVAKAQPEEQVAPS